MVIPPAGTTTASTHPFKYICPVIIIIKPVNNSSKGNALRWVRKYDKNIDDTPSTSASNIIPHSNNGLAKNPKPDSGKKVSSKGTTAQCTAHRVDAVMPMLSNFEVFFLECMMQIYIKCNLIAF